MIRYLKLKLDELLADENVEVVGSLKYENEITEADPLKVM